MSTVQCRWLKKSPLALGCGEGRERVLLAYVAYQKFTRTAVVYSQPL